MTDTLYRVWTEAQVEAAMEVAGLLRQAARIAGAVDFTPNAPEAERRMWEGLNLALRNAKYIAQYNPEVP